MVDPYGPGPVDDAHPSGPRSAPDASEPEIDLRRLELGHELRAALSGGQFEMRFEPVVSLADGRLVGCESLVRWRHPVRGVLAPEAFMSALEEDGLQGELDLWVVEQVVPIAAGWRRRGHDIVVCLNVSAQGLTEGFAELLRSMCARHEVPPSTIGVELLESIRPHPDLMDQVEELKELGVYLAIDDFGTGYSSLAALSRLRASALKIDGQFVAGAESDDGARAIIEASVSVARAFEMTVVAEWVERESQRAALLEMGVDQGQGALYGEPLTPEEFERRHLEARGRSPRST